MPKEEAKFQMNNRENKQNKYKNKTKSKTMMIFCHK